MAGFEPLGQPPVQFEWEEGDMRMRIVVSVILLGAAAGAPAQQKPEPEGARELYYRAMVQKDPPPPVRRAAARSGGVPAPAATAPDNTGAMHLGLRYNLVLVDADSGSAQPAAPDRMFRAGDCFAIDLEANRAGFLYVLAKQSSGSWQPLLPSTDPDMATESNAIVPGKKIRIPLEHCFELRNPPGVETLFVVLSREPRDTFELYENTKAPGATQTPGAPRRTAASVQVADASVTDGAVTRLREQFGSRDIAIKKVSQPLGAAEPPESVYVVNSSSSPSSNLAAQIDVHHR
jgi:hypothetical protein